MVLGGVAFGSTRRGWLHQSVCPVVRALQVVAPGCNLCFCIIQISLVIARGGFFVWLLEARAGAGPIPLTV